MKKINEDGKAVQQDDRGNPLLTYNWIDTKAGGGRGADIGLPRCSWRKNSLLINFPFDLLKKAGIEPESLRHLQVHGRRSEGRQDRTGRKAEGVQAHRSLCLH